MSEKLWYELCIIFKIHTIAKDMLEVNRSAGEMANGSSHVNTSAAELSDLAGRIKEMVGRFMVQSDEG